MKTAKHALLLAALCYSTFAAADSITLLWDASPWNPNPPAGPFSISLTSGGAPGAVAPDRYHGMITAVSPGYDAALLGDGSGVLPESLFTYCYELTQYYSGGTSYVYDVVPATTANTVNSSTLDFLGAVNSQIGGFGAFGWLHPANANMAAAIQLGIWETRYDPGNFSISSGVFSASGLTPAVTAYLTTYQNAMASTSDLPAQYVARLENASAQDQITGLRASGFQTVPEPGSLALVGMGMLVTAIARRQSKKNALAA